MSLEQLFNALAAIVWPILNVPLLLFATAIVVLTSAAVVTWFILKTRYSRTASSATVLGSKKQKDPIVS